MNNNILLEHLLLVCFSLFQFSIATQGSSRGSCAGNVKGQVFTQVGVYRDTVVALKMINRRSLDINRAVRLELKLVSINYNRRNIRLHPTDVPSLN